VPSAERGTTEEGAVSSAAISEARDQLSRFARQLIPPRDLDSALRACAKLLPHAEHAELVGRRKELQEGTDSKRGGRP
jgi:hypothetical protein